MHCGQNGFMETTPRQSSSGGASPAHVSLGGAACGSCVQLRARPVASASLGKFGWGREAADCGEVRVAICCSESVVVSMGKWLPVASRRGESSIPVKGLPVDAQWQKQPKSCASANFATSACLWLV